MMRWRNHKNYQTHFAFAKEMPDKFHDIVLITSTVYLS
jgi:hypothetical protein